ncbi:MAG: acetolactate decarboxylase [Candidatus Obscuribacterales bacterium]|nr:acetolactate decarboxylase [Candidatus Obscuribacterales bacterium]
MKKMKSSLLKLQSLLTAALWLLSFLPCGAQGRSPMIMLNERGSMPELYKDNAAAKIKLSELKEQKHIYALGPLSKLRGEILILDSVPYECRAHKGEVQLKSDWNEEAAFLVWSKVTKWKKIAVPPAVLSVALLETWLASMTGGENFPLRHQFPFIIKGKFAHLGWHIVSVQDDGKPLTPQKHREQRFHGMAKGVSAEIFGFYSPDDQGIFIAAGRKVHMHAKVGDYLVAHVEDFEPKLDSSLTLFVPAR